MLKNKKYENVAIIEEKIKSKTKPDEISIIKYAKGKFLGKGGFAKCYEFTNLSNNKVLAAKIIPKASLKKARHRQKLLTEIKIHRSLSHNNIVKFEHVFEDQKNVYILLEMCTNHTLNELIKRRKMISEFEAQYYMLQIVLALKYLQQNKIIHRDLKLGNLFLNEKLKIKLGDFGLAAKLKGDDEKRHTVCGTPNYLAPEILSNRVGHGYKVDIWSLGVVLYTMIIGRPPFETREVKLTYEKIRKGIYSFPKSVDVSSSVKKLIAKIFVLDPKKRPSLDDILEDDFLNNGIGIAKNMHISTLAMKPNKLMMENLIGKDAMMQSKQNKVLKNSKINSKGITSSKSSSRRIKKNNKRQSKIKNEVYVKKWVDYSSKYGLGYLLSNNCCGVYFNDFSKLIFDPILNYFEYIEKSKITKIDESVYYYINSYPQTLQKKVTLLFHFRSYLESIKPPSNNYDSEAKQVPKRKRGENMIYLKKWMKTKHASLLRLSNKVVQVIFSDKTEIILSSENKMVTYVNKKGERLDYPISSALDSENSEMAKRLKYTKEILTVMLNSKNNN